METQSLETRRRLTAPGREPPDDKRCFDETETHRRRSTCCQLARLQVRNEEQLNLRRPRAFPLGFACDDQRPFREGHAQIHQPQADDADGSHRAATNLIRLPAIDAVGIAVAGNRHHQQQRSDTDGEHAGRPPCLLQESDAADDEQHGRDESQVLTLIDRADTDPERIAHQ